MIQDLLKATESQFKKRFKTSETEFQFADAERPPTGLIIDNPLFEYILDRRFLAYGRFYLVYGKKGSCKTSLFFDIAKTFQRNNGEVIWLETENAADLDYARKQGVDTSRMVLQHPQTLEESLNLAEMYIRNLSKVDPNQETPLLICLDSLAGSVTEYEQNKEHSITDVTPGAHARILSRFYREMEFPLAQEKCIFLALNQQKEKIGGMGGFGEEVPESMIGGNAPLFSSTYQFRMSRTADLKQKNKHGVERKYGSSHSLVCKRNKLGREGNMQKIEFDMYINGGIDWYTPLVKTLAKNYTDIVSGAGAHNYWMVPNCKYIADDGTEKVIDTEQSYYAYDLAKIIANSTDAKEVIRKAFEIPDLPSAETIAQVDADIKKKRVKKPKKLTPELEEANSE